MEEEQKSNPSQTPISESCSDSEFDIYADYDSGHGGNNSMSFDAMKVHENLKPRKSKNMSQVHIAKDGHEDHQDMQRMFKRPSLTVKIGSTAHKKASKAEELRQFRNKMQSWFVHK